MRSGPALPDCRSLRGRRGKHHAPGRGMPRELLQKLEIPVIYKSSFEKDNRSTAQNYRGPGLEEGLRVLARVKEEFGFPLISDVHYPQQIKPSAEVLDVLQIPAYLCMQTHLVEEAARTGKVLNLKHGQFLAPENMMKPTQKALDAETIVSS